MPTTLTCPRCQLEVEVDDEATDRWVTCRHCLISISNPRRAEAITKEAPQPGARATCDVCGEALQPKWRYCPQCKREARLSRGDKLDTGLETDIRRDAGAGSVIAAGLCVFLGVGVVGWLLANTGEIIKDSKEGGTIALLVVLAIGGVVALMVTQMMTGRETGGKVITGFLGALAIAGIVGIGFILILCAGVIAFLNSCGKGFH